MGVLTGVSAIDGEQLAMLRKKRWLRRLLDVVGGWKKQDVLELPDSPHNFRSIGLDKAWYDFPYLLAGFGNPFANRSTYFLESSFKKIPHKSCDGAYMTAESVILFLGAFKYMVWSTYKKAGKSTKNIATIRVPPYAYLESGRKKETSATTLIAAGGLGDVYDELFGLAHQHLADLQEADDWTDYDGRPIDEDGISYIGGYFKAYIQFLTECVHDEESGFLFQGVVMSSS